MIKVKKRVSLGFLGEEYSESYITCYCVSIKEAEEELKGTVKEEVVQRFVDGKINQEGKLVDITKDDLVYLPAEVFVETFLLISGAKTDPKV